MSSAASAPSAFQAALAGVSHGFATRRSSRSAAHTRQHAEPPPPSGTDSNYGVRSLSNSQEWLHDDDEDDEPPSDTSEQSSSGGSDDAPDDQVRVSEAPDDAGTPSSVSTTLPPFRRSSTDETLVPVNAPVSIDSFDQTVSPPTTVSPPLSTSVPPPTPRWQDGTPTPPAATLAPSTASLGPERSAMRTPSPSIPRTRPPPSFPVATHALFDMLADAPSASEPSSPASLASYPSCIASMSSLSRTSSPSDWDWRHPLSQSVATADMVSDDAQSFDGLGVGEGRQSAELVLPTLALPSTSLHLGLERWPGLPSGTRIALLASPEETRDVLGALVTRQTCVQLAHGAVGVVKDGALLATILTGHSVNNVRQRTTEAYTALHSLLNPSTTPEQRREIEPMVASYSSRADWVHLVVNLDDVDCADLSTVVAVTTVEAEANRLAMEKAAVTRQEAALAEAVDDNVVDDSTPVKDKQQGSSRLCRGRSSDSLSGSTLRDVDDTPRATAEPREFNFPAPLPEVPEDEDITTSTVSPARYVEDAVVLLERVLDDADRVQAASFEHFFNWRPQRAFGPGPSPLAVSPASSAFDGASSPAPLPTVTRASGEWEATLSRRLAHRRELDATAKRARQAPAPGTDLSRRRRRRRASPSPKPGNCGPGPLFPRRHISTAELGLADLVDKVFAPVKSVLAKTSWTHMMFACAIALAVGCGFWAARAQ